jgi:hypothetical protein
MNTQRTVIALLMQLRAAAAIACITAIVGCAQHAATPAAPSDAGTMNAQSMVAEQQTDPAVATAPTPQQATTATPPALRPVPDPQRSLTRTHAAQTRGLAWTLANQRPDGSFGTFESPRAREIYLDTQASHRAFHTATTALVCWSLVVPARTDPACSAALLRGLTWLEAQGEVGRASGNTFYSVWAHTYLLELASAILADPARAADHQAWRTILEREVQVARREQSAEGGWAYYDFNHVGQNPSGHESTSFNTGAMIEALLNARTQGADIPAGTIADALTCMERMRIPSGSFAYGTYAELNVAGDYNKVSGASGRLQVCNLALFRSDSKGTDGETLLRGVELLRERHFYIEIARGRVMPHEAFYRNSGYYYFFGHYYCARVLQMAPAGPRRDLLVRWLAEQMAIDQNRDGSWFDYPLYGYGFAYATGFAMRTLEILEPMIAEQVRATGGTGAVPMPPASSTVNP